MSHKNFISYLRKSDTYPRLILHKSEPPFGLVYRFARQNGRTDYLV